MSANREDELAPDEEFEEGQEETLIGTPNPDSEALGEGMEIQAGQEDEAEGEAEGQDETPETPPPATAPPELLHVVLAHGADPITVDGVLNIGGTITIELPSKEAQETGFPLPVDDAKVLLTQFSDRYKRKLNGEGSQHAARQGQEQPDPNAQDNDPNKGLQEGGQGEVKRTDDQIKAASDAGQGSQQEGGGPSAT